MCRQKLLLQVRLIHSNYNMTLDIFDRSNEYRQGSQACLLRPQQPYLNIVKQFTNHGTGLAGDLPQPAGSMVSACKDARATHLGKDSLIGGALFHGTADLVKVFCPGQFVMAVGVQETEVAV